MGCRTHSFNTTAQHNSRFYAHWGPQTHIIDHFGGGTYTENLAFSGSSLNLQKRFGIQGERTQTEPPCLTLTS